MDFGGQRGHEGQLGLHSIHTNWPVAATLLTSSSKALKLEKSVKLAFYHHCKVSKSNSTEILYTPVVMTHVTGRALIQDLKVARWSASQSLKL